MKNRQLLKGAIASMFVLALISSGVALATHPFTDVADGRFYSDAVDWVTHRARAPSGLM